MNKLRSWIHLKRDTHGRAALLSLLPACRAGREISLYKTCSKQWLGRKWCADTTKKNTLQHKDSSKASVCGSKGINSSASFDSKETPEASLPWPWLHTGRKWKAQLRQSFWLVSKGIDWQGCLPRGWMQWKIHLPSVASETGPRVSERVRHLKRHVGSLPLCSPGGRRKGKFDAPSSGHY